MDAGKIETNLEKMFDNYLVFHGYTPYMRDYEMIVHSPTKRIYMRFLFRFCVSAAIKSRLGPDVWRRSMDDSLLDIEYPGSRSTGYVWGVKNQELYPGPRLIPETSIANEWSSGLGIGFYEVEIDANAQSINLIFADLAVDEIGEGYSPFIVQ